MRLNRFSILLSVFSLILLTGFDAFTQTTDVKTVGDMIEKIYSDVSWEAGKEPDWNKVKDYFHEKAIVTMRSSQTLMSVFDRDGFINDFVTFWKQLNTAKRAFKERVVNKKVTVLRDAAYCMVLYEAHIPGSPRPPQKGVDNFHLLKKDGRWYIMSLINEIPAPGMEIPEELKD